MKSTTLLALFLLSAFTSYLPLATAVVLDTDGEPVRNGGGMYFVLPVLRGRGGGLALAATGNETYCPLSVVQSRSEVFKGLPTTFSSLLRIPFIGEGHRLNIRFSYVPWCAPTPSSWTVVKDLPEGPAVKLGNENTLPYRFTIEKASSAYNDYTLLFCESEGSKCGYLGTPIDGDRNWPLVVTENNPLVVKFQKVGFPIWEAPPALKSHVLSRSER
ncbi:Kunitz-type trypsin inhibitor KTI1 [Spatholobus suberectus]|nr:Kunitz-type trypsin inhibitor KTI1 [Spatholobus suberectus]